MLETSYFVHHKIILSIRYADHVSVGNEVLVEENYELIPAEVINVSTLSMQGDCISIHYSFMNCFKFYQPIQQTNHTFLFQVPLFLSQKKVTL